MDTPPPNAPAPTPPQERPSTHPLTIVLAVVLGGMAVLLFGTGLLPDDRRPPHPPTALETAPPPVPELEVTVLDVARSDAPVKTQCTIDAAISGPLTPANVTAVLHRRLAIALDSKGWRNQSGRTSAAIVRLYPSARAYRRDKGSWLGMISWSRTDGQKHLSLRLPKASK